MNTPENAQRGSVESTALLAAWRKYTDNPHARHPCENFKAGWVANRLMQTDSETTGDDIKERCRDFRC